MGEFASKGVAGAALGTGIGGLALGVLNGAGGLLNMMGGANCGGYGNGYAAIGTEEIAHGDKIHAQLVRIIQNYRAKHGVPDPVMQKQYDIEHQKLMHKAAKSKAKLEMYKKPA